MRYMRSNENHSFPGSRFETTYGSSYNRPFNQTIKQPTTKLFEKDERMRPPVVSRAKIEVNLKPEPVREPVTTSMAEQIAPMTLDYGHMITQIACITDSLFLSGMQAITAEKVRRLGITLVVSLLADGTGPRLPPPVQALTVSIEDAEHADLRKHFDRLIDRIEAEERRGGRTLVHCMAGISRSATLVLAYLMRHNRMRLRDAHELVHARRPYIQPNLGFWRQLIEYERSLFGTASVSMAPADGSRVPVPNVPPSALSAILAVAPLVRSQPRLFQSRPAYPFH